MVSFHDPRAEPGAPLESYDLAVDVAQQPTTIGLVANGFPDSEAFLDQVEKALAVAVPDATFRRWNKYNASSVISDEMLSEVVESTQAVVAAYGH